MDAYGQYKCLCVSDVTPMLSIGNCVAYHSNNHGLNIRDQWVAALSWLTRHHPLRQPLRPFRRNRIQTQIYGISLEGRGGVE